ncbi:MAG: DNA-directed RNA polymerase subunit omega [Lachnospiraceae bacterium]|nr:DNA-directed RNA polymerase subunit omega [Lachnospiraceae bacterium]
MIHPSYKEMMEAVNSESEDDTTPIVSSRYSIVMATAKRARQIVNGDEPLVPAPLEKKPLSIAVEEIYQGEVKILPDEVPQDV